MSAHFNGGATQRLIERYFAGDPQAKDALFRETYSELKRIASRALRIDDRNGVSVQTTQVVHDAYLKLAGAGADVTPASRAQFLALMARIMRNLVIDHCRARATMKRGGDRIVLEFDDGVMGDDAAWSADEWLALHEALEQLGERDEQTAGVIELRFFGGMTTDEIAEALDVGRSTVNRKWVLGRAWLSSALSGQRPPT